MCFFLHAPARPRARVVSISGSGAAAGDVARVRASRTRARTDAMRDLEFKCGSGVSFLSWECSVAERVEVF